MFYELRQYKVLPGKMDAWLAMMEGEFIPFAESHGMNITASFRGEEDETLYVWMRRFESEAERERVDKAVYESDYMKNDIGPRVSDVLAKDGHSVQRILPTSTSSTK
jgi:hypothetical protein